MLVVQGSVANILVSYLFTHEKVEGQEVTHSKGLFYDLHWESNSLVISSLDMPEDQFRERATRKKKTLFIFASYCSLITLFMFVMMLTPIHLLLFLLCFALISNGNTFLDGTLFSTTVRWNVWELYTLPILAKSYTDRRKCQLIFSHLQWAQTGVQHPKKASQSCRMSKEIAFGTLSYIQAKNWKQMPAKLQVQSFT